MGADDKMPEDWVKKNNIAAVFQVPNDKNLKEWKSRWKGKLLEIKRPGKSFATPFIVTALDTCSDSDCRGCCTKNANTGGGTLIDLEINTAMRFWDKTRPRDVPGLEKIQWRIVEKR